MVIQSDSAPGPYSDEKLPEVDRDSIDDLSPVDDKAPRPNQSGNDVVAPAPIAEEKAAPTNDAGPGPPPDGGLQAWLQVAGSWMLFFNTWGLLNTFGVYQTFYESGKLWHASSSDISWIGAIQGFMVPLLGAFVGPLYDRGYLKTLLIIGSFGVVFGHMMLSLSKTYWESLLAQGFVVGIGSGFLFVPAVAILSQYFSKKLGLAIGLAASGSSMGGIIYPIMFYKLIDRVGFGWSVRILGFTALVTLLLPISVMKLRVQPGKVRDFIDPSAFKDVPYLMAILGCFVGFIGLILGLFYISFFGETTGFTDPTMSFYIVPVLNAGSVLGRTLPNILSDKIGALNVIAPGALILSIVLFCFLAVSNLGGIIVCTLLFGFFSGIFIALPPVVFVTLTKDKSKVGTRIGMGYGFVALGYLASGPAGGAILGNDPRNLNWNGVWIYAAVTVFASSIIFAVLRVVKGGVKLKIKI